MNWTLIKITKKNKYMKLQILSTSGSMGVWKFLLWIILIIIFTYAIIRYHILRGVPWDNFPLYISNKAISLSPANVNLLRSQAGIYLRLATRLDIATFRIDEFSFLFYHHDRTGFAFHFNNDLR